MEHGGAAMTNQILVRLPEEIATRFKAVVPPRQRNRFIADLVKTALAVREAELGKIAAEVTRDELENAELVAEDSDWNTTLADGLDGTHEQTKPKSRPKPKSKTR